MADQISDAIQILNDCVTPLIYRADLFADDVVDRVSALVSDLHILRDIVTYGDADYVFRPQSGATPNALQDSVQVQENVEFHHASMERTEETNTFMDPLRSMADDDMSLDNFFRRPVKVDDFTWSIGGHPSRTIQPWLAYFSNPRVINRLNNYKLVTAKLMVKTIVNGSPFHYGRSMMTYLPKQQYDAFGVTTSVTGASSFVEMSQRPHYFINPTESTGGEMLCPFFHEENYIDFQSINYASLGLLTWFELNPLRHANGSTDGVTVTTFVWLEDVKFSIPTSVNNPSLVPQMSNITRSKDETDEANATGTISGPATMMANLASKFARVPIISPYALATEQVLRGAAMIAKVFGYSRPLVTAVPDRAIPTMMADLATCTVPDNAKKLTIDDKQELTIDPRIAGIGPEDPLSIRYIAGRESWIDSFTWSTADAAGTVKWNSRVTPMLYRLSGTKVNMTPMCYAATPFHYWTGTIKFRFQVVCSRVHKGRLRVVYDPNYLATNEYNVNSMKIVDISEETDFTIEIGVAQSRTLLETALIGNIPHTDFFGTTLFATTSDVANGVISVAIVNDLAAPAVGEQNVSINVFVSAGDDFEVFSPSNYISHYVLQPQMSLLSRNKAEVDSAEQSSSTVLCVGSTNHDLVSKIYCGESIASLRLLSKRYNLHETFAWSGGVALNVFAGARCAFPFYRGNVGTTVHQRFGGIGYNFVNTVTLHWITLPFAGHRGSVRYKLIPLGNAQTATPSQVYIERIPPLIAEYYVNRAIATSWTSDSNAAHSSVAEFNYFNTDGPLPGYMGLAYTSEKVNPAIEFEVPYYSNKRFQPGRPDDYVVNSQEHYGGFTYRIYNAANDKSVYQTWVAAGEDFQVFFFIGVPSLYFEGSPPPSI